MEIIIFFLIISAAGLIIWGVVSSRQVRPALLPRANFNPGFSKPRFNPLQLLPTRSFLEKTGIFEKIKRRIDNARLRISPETFFNLKVFIMLGLGGLSVVIAGKFEPVFFIIGLVIGYIGPEFYLSRRISRRKYMIARRLPETVDLLGLCIEAGLDFVNAVNWVINKTSPSPMIEELAFVLEEIKWGKPRVQALKDMARRLDIPEVNSFAQTIIQAERMGTPVAEAFAILSEDTRAQRFHRGERIALQAPIKILLPLIFFIMPVIGIVIGGPILLQFMQGGLSGLR